MLPIHLAELASHETAMDPTMRVARFYFPWRAEAFISARSWDRARRLMDQATHRRAFEAGDVTGLIRLAATWRPDR